MEVRNAGMSIEVIFACIFFVLGVISIIWMIISIFKAGDERKEIIILKASHWTFIETVGILFINLFYYIGLRGNRLRHQFICIVVYYWYSLFNKFINF